MDNDEYKYQELEQRLLKEQEQARLAREYRADKAVATDFDKILNVRGDMDMGAFNAYNVSMGAADMISGPSLNGVVGAGIAGAHDITVNIVTGVVKGVRSLVGLSNGDEQENSAQADAGQETDNPNANLPKKPPANRSFKRR